MLLYLLIMIMLWSMIFLFLNHPLSIGGTLMIQTILISILTGLISFNYWFSYILFLVMIGGMLILFIYMTSVASNEKFKFSPNLMIPIILMPLIFMMLFVLDNFYSNLYIMNMDIMMFNKLISFKLSLNKFMNYPLNLIMILIMIYLLITLIAIVKITKLNSGPLRQKF